MSLSQGDGIFFLQQMLRPIVSITSAPYSTGIQTNNCDDGTIVFTEDSRNSMWWPFALRVVFGTTQVGFDWLWIDEKTINHMIGILGYDHQIGCKRQHHTYLCLHRCCSCRVWSILGCLFWILAMCHVLWLNIQGSFESRLFGTFTLILQYRSQICTMNWLDYFDTFRVSYTSHEIVIVEIWCVKTILISTPDNLD